MSADVLAQWLEVVAQQVGYLRVEQQRTAGYLARQEIRGLLDRIAVDPGRLEPCGYKVYSQSDEDGILAEIFRRLDLATGVFCEIGVESGIECNTLYLIHCGWRGGWLEANQAQREPIERRFGALMAKRRLALRTGRVDRDNVNGEIDAVLRTLGAGEHSPDFLSIDIDGMDIYLLESLVCRPSVICIEYNAKFPPPLSKRPAYNADLVWDGTDYMGSSLVAVADVAAAKGYSLVATNLTGTPVWSKADHLLVTQVLSAMHAFERGRRSPSRTVVSARSGPRGCIS